ncbi:thaumatin family protein [Streptomyces mirabilis]|uniref:thaumatin family protein n=1 Tax=Streptomyces mirabilis TaxID=68239 RepID=UPI00338E1966
MGHQVSSHRKRRKQRTSRIRRGPLAAGAAVLACLAVAAGLLLTRTHTPVHSVAVRDPSAAAPVLADPKTGTASPSDSGSARPTPAWRPGRTVSRHPSATASRPADAGTSNASAAASPAGGPRHPHRDAGQLPGPDHLGRPRPGSGTPGGGQRVGAASRASRSFTVPAHWDARVWARTGCSFDGACLTGGCGHFQCGRTWGEFPSTLAEFNLDAWNGMDFYDVSLVEGNNLPMGLGQGEVHLPALGERGRLVDRRPHHRVAELHTPAVEADQTRILRLEPGVEARGRIPGGDGDQGCGQVASICGRSEQQGPPGQRRQPGQPVGEHPLQTLGHRQCAVERVLRTGRGLRYGPGQFDQRQRIARRLPQNGRP